MTKPQFIRLAWGGIQTDNAGRQALSASTSVLAFLASDYADARDDDRLAISRVQEMVKAAISRETEERDLNGPISDTPVRSGESVLREAWTQAVVERDEAREACSNATESPWYWTGTSEDDLASMGCGMVIHMTAGQLRTAIAARQERIDLAAALATIREMNERLLEQTSKRELLDALVDLKRSEITELRAKLAAERERNAMIGEHLRAAIGLVSE